MVLIGRVLRVELRDPRLDRGEHLGGRTGTQLAAGAVAGAVFGLLEVREQFGDGGAGDLGGLDQRPPGVGDAVDAAVLMVAVRVARVVLHVPDQRVVPIEEVERTIGRELQVHRAEVAVGGTEQVAIGLAHEACAVVALRPEADAQEADRIARHEVALVRVGEVARRHELPARARAGALGDELLHLGLFDAVGHLRRERQRPPVLARGRVGEERLLPAVERETPRVGDVHLHALEAVGLRVETPGATVVAAARPVGRLDLAVEETAFQ